MKSNLWRIQQLTEALKPFAAYGTARLELFGENSQNAFLTSTIADGKTTTANLLPEDWKRAIQALTSIAVCQVPGCQAASKLTRGMCLKHYARWWRYGDPSKSSRKTSKQAIFDAGKAQERPESLSPSQSPSKSENRPK